MHHFVRQPFVIFPLDTLFPQCKTFVVFWQKTATSHFHRLLLKPILLHEGISALTKTNDSLVVQSQDYLMNASKLLSQALPVFSESSKLGVVQRCPGARQHPLCRSVRAVFFSIFCFNLISKVQYQSFNQNGAAHSGWFHCNLTKHTAYPTKRQSWLRNHILSFAKLPP